MTVDLHISLDHPRADVFLAGNLDAEAAPFLQEVVDSAHIVGCHRITLHLDGLTAPDDDFVAALDRVRRCCAEDGGSLDVGSDRFPIPTQETPRGR